MLHADPAGLMAGAQSLSIFAMEILGDVCRILASCGLQSAPIYYKVQITDNWQN
jgi:hypothetical protein